MNDIAKSAARWFRKYRHVIVSASVAGVGSTFVTTYLGDYLAFPYLVIGWFVSGIAAGSVYAFLLSRFPRKPL